MRVALLLAAFALAGAPVAAPSQPAPPPLRLPLGTSVSLGLGKSGKLDSTAQAARPLSAHDVEMIQELVTEHPDATGPNGVIVHSDRPAPPLEPAHVRFTFVPFDGGKSTVLVVENGFNGSFLYRARIGRGANAMVTDVCQLPPNNRGYEHWPYPLDWIEITDIRPVDWNGTLRCE
jgi:hypothetical protein